MSEPGIATTMTHQQGKLVVCRSQDVSAYLEQNRRERAEFQRFSNVRRRRKVADIPLIVVEQWLKEGVSVFDPNDNKEVQRRLNSPEWSYLRTSPGKMAMKG